MVTFLVIDERSRRPWLPRFFRNSTLGPFSAAKSLLHFSLFK